MAKTPPAVQEMQVQSLGWEDPLEKEMATHSRILAWKIPWRSMVGCTTWGHKRVRHDSATKQQAQERSPNKPTLLMS